MDTQRYVRFQRGSRKKLRRRIAGAATIAVIILAAAFVIGKLTSDSPEYRQKVSLIEENRVLREQIDELNARVSELESRVIEQDEYISSIPAQESGDASGEAESDEGSFSAETPRSE